MEKAKTEVLRYLGHRGQEVSEDLSNLLEECIVLMRNTASLRQVSLQFTVLPDSDGILLVGDGDGKKLLLRGRHITNHLSDCKQAILLAATLGTEADLLIRKWERVDLTRSLILDACATQLIEAHCDEIQQQICTEAAASGLVATWRFSPGYGDFPLDLQPSIIEVLNATRRIGLTCTDHFILLPRKSVTAVIGLSPDKTTSSSAMEPFLTCPQNKSFANYCLNCAMHNTCSFRKEG